MGHLAQMQNLPYLHNMLVMMFHIRVCVNSADVLIVEFNLINTALSRIVRLKITKDYYTWAKYNVHI